MFQWLPVRTVVQPICAGELSGLSPLFSLSLQKKHKGKGIENSIIIFFSICFNVTFTDNWQNLRT